MASSRAIFVSRALTSADGGRSAAALARAARLPLFTHSELLLLLLLPPPPPPPLRLAACGPRFKPDKGQRPSERTQKRKTRFCHKPLGFDQRRWLFHAERPVLFFHLPSVTPSLTYE